MSTNVQPTNAHLQIIYILSTHVRIPSHRPAPVERLAPQYVCVCTRAEIANADVSDDTDNDDVADDDGGNVAGPINVNGSHGDRSDSDAGLNCAGWQLLLDSATLSAYYPSAAGERLDGTLFADMHGVKLHTLQVRGVLEEVWRRHSDAGDSY